MKIKWTAPFLDGSGYGQAARNAIVALNSVGVNVMTKIVKFSNDDIKNLGKGATLARQFEDDRDDYDINVSQVTPNFFSKEMVGGKYNIGFLFWEVVGVDPLWVWNCNLMNEIWTSSYEHAGVLKTFGVKVPIKIIPVPMNFTKPEPLEIPDAVGFKFYSIFQWTERKNPRTLVIDYLQAFNGYKDVTLILKTYRSNYSEMEKGAIKDDLARFIRESRVENPPKIVLLLDQLSDEEIMSLHTGCNVFVSAHRGEGWGMPQMEAMSVGNPIISTNWGGIHHWLSNDNSWLIPFKYGGVFGMSHIPWYNTGQLWANIDNGEFKKAMLEAYNNPSLVETKGLLAQKLVHETFSFESVGKLMKDRLEEIKL